MHARRNKKHDPPTPISNAFLPVINLYFLCFFQLIPHAWSSHVLMVPRARTLQWGISAYVLKTGWETDVIDVSENVGLLII